MITFICYLLATVIMLIAVAAVFSVVGIVAGLISAVAVSIPWLGVIVVGLWLIWFLCTILLAPIKMLAEWLKKKLTK